METTPAENVIGKFGGLTKTARALSTPEKDFPVSTVQGWRERGRIPEEYWGPLVQAGKEVGAPISPKDFLSPITAEVFDGWFEAPEAAR